MRRQSPHGLGVASLLCLALAGCFQPLPNVPQSDAGSLFDTGLDDLGVDFDTGGPPDAVTDDTTPIGEGSGSGAPALPTPSLAEVSRDLFETACADCHISQTLSDLWLASNAGLRDRLLGPSLQAPALPRIAPGDPDGSYLWRKVEGSHLEAGGLGEAMPLGASRLSAAQTDLLRRWIEGGAPP